MSPKLHFSMLLCMPYYLFSVIFFNKNSDNINMVLKFLSFILLTSIWILLLFLPGNLAVNYLSANVGVLTLVLINVYSHVDKIEALFGMDSEKTHILYDVMVSTGSVSAMLFAAFVPQYVYHNYITYKIIACNVGLISPALVIAVFNLVFVMTCKKLLMGLPKCLESSYLTKINLSESHYVAAHYFAMIVFLCVFLRNDEFRSTMCTVFVSLLP